MGDDRFSAEIFLQCIYYSDQSVLYIDHKLLCSVCNNQKQEKEQILFRYVLLLYQCYVYPVPGNHASIGCTGNAFHLDNIYGITFLYIIFGLPMNTFLYTGAIKAIPEALDEAAMIDGANPIQIFSRVIFPVLKPTTATVAILSFMWTWNDFSMPLVLLSDESQQTLQLAQYVFKSQFSVDYNLAFASYLLVLAPVLIVYIFCQKWIMNGVVAGAVK